MKHVNQNGNTQKELLNTQLKTDMNTVKLYLLTLKDAIILYQGRKRLNIEDRNERLSFNAFRHLSDRLGYKDSSTVYKLINQSTSKVKMGVEDLAHLCIEMMDISPLEDLINEVKEKISDKKESIKNHYQEQLNFLEQ